MQGLTKFIMHSNVADILHQLDAMLNVHDDGERPGFLLLLGLPRTGKKKVVSYWLDEECSAAVHRQGERPPILDVAAWLPHGARFGRGVYVTPKTCMVFSEMVYSLGKLSTRYAPTYTRTWYRQPRSLYTDSQFTSLFAFTRSELHRFRMRTIVIRNAHLLDTCALEMLQHIRDESRKQISFIFVAHMQEHASIDEPLADEFLRVPEAGKECVRIELQRLTEREYVTVVLDAVLNDLNLFFAEDVADDRVVRQLAHAFWHRTQYDWKQINDIALEIRRKVPPNTAGERVVTRALLEQLLNYSFAT